VSAQIDLSVFDSAVLLPNILPPPKLPPYICTSDGPVHPDAACTECGGKSEGRAEVRHAQTLYLFQLARTMRVYSKAALCNSCAATARKRGWSGLPNTLGWIRREGSQELLSAMTAKTEGVVN